jgi:hypothetical protein
VHPHGLGSVTSATNLNVSFTGPNEEYTPDYGGIGAAAGGAWAKKIAKASELEEAMKEAIRVVTEDKRSAILDVYLSRFQSGEGYA